MLYTATHQEGKEVMDQNVEQLILRLSQALIARYWKIVTAESCTGGGLAYALTQLAGSSTWFERGLVTYSNEAKEELLGVKPKTLLEFGAVSGQTACEMAEGALRYSHANVSIAITGIAGPDGGTKEKPVGTVWIALAGNNLETQSFLLNLSGTRTSIREQTISIAIEKMLAFL